MSIREEVELLQRIPLFANVEAAKLKLPVSLQIILRALIEEGLEWANDPAVLANIEAHANAIRRTRMLARRRAGSARSRDGGGPARRRK